MTRKKSRSRLAIAVEILRAAKNGGVRKPRMVYRSNVDHNLLKEALVPLLGNKLLAETSEFYVTTQKGAGFITKYEELMAEIAPFVTENNSSTQRGGRVE